MGTGLQWDGDGSIGGAEFRDLRANGAGIISGMGI